MVGVDQPTKALSMHIKAIEGENCLSSHSCHFVKNIFPNQILHAYVQCVYIVQAKYQIAPSKAVVGVDRPMKALSMHTSHSTKVQKITQLLWIFFLILISTLNKYQQ